MNITRNGDQKMLNEIIICVLVIVVLFEAIMVSAISQRCKESKRELKKLLKEKQQIEEARQAMRFGYRR